MFSDMKPAERRLLEACQKGEFFFLGEKLPTEKTVDNEIRGEFLRALILSNNQEIEEDGEKYILKIDPLGIMFSGIYISGEFDFSFCKTNISFKFVNSFFENEINLSASEIEFLNLKGCVVKSINGRGLICKLDIYLENFSSSGVIDFGSALIDGSIKCSNGKFRNETSKTLNFDKAKIQGSVFLDNHFESLGEVSFQAAKIGSNLECNNGKFINENLKALDCNQAEIGGSVFLDKNFMVKGEVNFNSAQIESNIQCGRGKIINPDGFALYFGDAKISGNVLFKDELHIEGNISFTSIEINKCVIFSDIYVKGIFDFTSAKINIIEEIKNFWEKEDFKELHLDGLEYNHLSGVNLDSITLINWLSKMPKFKPQPYKQLAKILRNMGHHEDANNIMIKYNDELRKKDFLTCDRLFISILKCVYGKTAGYGYKPMSVIKWMSIVWLLCSLFYWNASKVAVFAPNNPLVFQKKDCYECHVEENGTAWSDFFKYSKYNSTNNWILNKNLDGEYTTFNPFMYSLDVILPIVDLQVEKDWGQYVPSNNGTLNDFTRWLMWFEILFGWIYSLILVAILSGLAKNEKD